MNTVSETAPRPDTGPIPERQRFMDWLRILAFALLVPYHVGMYYVSWDWHVKSPTLHPALEPFLMLTSPWRLGLLFIVAGVASESLWRRGPGFVRLRTRRLLWPLVFGMFVIVPPQAYFQVIHQFAYGGSYFDFMGLYLHRDKSFCRDGSCLSLPTWNHLWFLIYLWVYTMVGWLLLKLGPATPDRFAAWLSRHGNAQTLLLTLALPLIAARMLVGQFPSTHNLVHDLYNHAQYLSLFLMAWWGARSGLWSLAARHRRVALGLAALSWSLIILYMTHYATQAPPDAVRWAQRVLYGAMQWWCLVAVIGYARHHLDREHRWRVPLNRAVYCFYILHQTVIVLLTQALLPLHLPVAVEGPLLIVGTFAVCWLGYLLARATPGLRTAMGVSPPKREVLALPQAQRA